MSYLSALLFISSLAIALLGCSSSEEYPNLADVGDRPPKPSIEQINQQKAALLKIQKELQQEQGTPSL